MLRRKPTAITLTSEDITAYEDHRLAERNKQENINPANRTPAKSDGKIDPNDELKPLPGDRAKVRGGAGLVFGPGSGSGLGRDDRIMGR